MANEINRADDALLSIRKTLNSEGVLRQIQTALPRGMKADRLVRVAITAIHKNPDLLKCTHQSICASIVQAAELGLEPVGALGQAYLVPYGNVCQLIVGYRGMIDLARRSGQILSIEAHPVFEGEHFEYERGLAPKLVHRNGAQVDRTKLLYAYAVAQLVGGGHQFEVMTKADVDAIRGRSKTGKSEKSPWATDYVEMARKTVVRRIFKYLPVSVEMKSLGEQLDREDAIEGYGEVVQVPPVEAPGGGGRTAQLKERLRSNKAQSAQEQAPPAEGSVDHPDGQDVPNADEGGGDQERDAGQEG